LPVGARGKKSVLLSETLNWASGQVSQKKIRKKKTKRSRKRKGFWERHQFQRFKFLRERGKGRVAAKQGEKKEVRACAGKKDASDVCKRVRQTNNLRQNRDSGCRPRQGGKGSSTQKKEGGGKETLLGKRTPSTRRRKGKTGIRLDLNLYSFWGEEELI